MLPQLKKEESSSTLNHSHFANGTLLLGPDRLAGSAHQRAEPGVLHPVLLMPVWPQPATEPMEALFSVKHLAFWIISLAHLSYFKYGVPIVRYKTTSLFFWTKGVCAFLLSFEFPFCSHDHSPGEPHLMHLDWAGECGRANCLRGDVCIRSWV